MNSNIENKINFFANDPSSPEVPLKETKYSINTFPQKWTIHSNSDEIGLFEPGSLDFQRCELNLAISRCLELWNDAFDGSFDSWSSIEKLNVYPQVDYRNIPNFRNGFNAYYDRTNLVFLFDKDLIKNDIVYTSESHDIACHELGHAILDSVHPEFFNTILPEIRAFHESFGDCSSILTTLGDESVRDAFLNVSDPLIESNCVSKLAEELGHGLFSINSLSSGECLRDAINDFKYQNPTTLPSSGPDTVLTRGGHSFSRVFTSGFYGVLARMFKLLKEEIQDKNLALTKTISDMERIFAGSVLSTFATPTLYRELALGMLKVDDQLFNGKYKQPIVEAFVEKNIISPIVESSLSTNIPLQSATGSAKLINEIKIPEKISDIKSNKFAEDMSEFLGISDGKKLNINIKKGLNDDFLIVKGIHTEWVSMDINIPNFPDNVKVYLPSGFDIVMNTKNKSMFSHSHATNSKTIDESKEDLKYLIEKNKIYIPKSDEKIDIKKLVILHKPYYLDSNNIVTRAYYA